MEHLRETEQLYTSYKPVMFGVAYRMLGSVMDAEDIVQEVFLALNLDTLDGVRNTKAYLCKIVTNRCIDRLRSTSKQREVYVGPWLPEPIVTDAENTNPSEFYLQKENISTAFLHLLQQLSWVERAVFVLREVLEYNYNEIADIVDKSPANCRQIFHRAKRSLGIHGDVSALHYDPDAPETSLSTPSLYEQTNTLVHQFTNALTSGNIRELVNILAADATAYSDGGGKVISALHPIYGADKISRFLMGLMEKMPLNYSFKFAVVNGLPGIVTYEGAKVQSVVSFHVKNGHFADLYFVTNPEKLRHVK